MHISRSGNDVVKTANELHVDKHAEGSSSASNGNGNAKTNGASAASSEVKKSHEPKKQEEEKEEVHTGDKRNADGEKPSNDGPETEEKKDAANGGKEAKKMKSSNGTAAPAPKSAAKDEGVKKPVEKKKPGRPKGVSSGEKKPAKEKKAPAVGRAERKTRSQSKAE